MSTTQNFTIQKTVAVQTCLSKYHIMVSTCVICCLVFAWGALVAVFKHFLVLLDVLTIKNP